jgi:very-short-patch-repair endonuclease
MPKDTTDPKKQILREERRKNERWFETRWEQIGGQPYESQYRYHPTRKWRADYAWASVKILLEVDGGGHKMYWKVYRNDVEKMNAALFMGWQVFRVTTDMVRADDVYFLEKLKVYINERKETART